MHILIEFDVNKDYENYNCLGPNYKCHFNERVERFAVYENGNESHEKSNTPRRGVF